MNPMVLLVSSLLAIQPPQPQPPQPQPQSQPPPPPAPALADTLDQVATGPSLAELQAAALDRAGLDPSQPARWRARARAAAALPTFTVQYDHRLDQGWTLDRAVGTADALRDDAGRQATLRFKATWALDRVIYTPDELRVARAALDLDDWRVRVISEINALYHERLELLATRALAPPPDIAAAIALEVRLREVEGLLTSLTGLEFPPS